MQLLLRVELESNLCFIDFFLGSFYRFFFLLLSGFNSAGASFGLYLDDALHTLFGCFYQSMLRITHNMFRALVGTLFRFRCVYW